ncbi:hypothetical protein [uncultured Porticoccus sp.]|uniref:hypothetical protein n=1 Tax=uncultured Porticoccus sp. TaxID=1256050 RepID=UPI002635F105|nr:hypothetical protein [uncultured Porticoccus sp.]
MNRSFLIILLSVGLLGATGCQSPTQSPTAQSQQPPQPQAQSPAAEETSEQDSPPETASTTGASQSSDTSEPSEMSEANPDQGSPASQAPPPPGGALSTDEEIAVLDQQLDASMAEFDGMIMDARAAAAEREQDSDSEGAPAGAGGPLFEEADITEELGGGPLGKSGNEEASGPDGASEPPSGQATTYGGDGAIIGRSGGSTVPENIPDGRDDDIVARQIREAAMKEQDPVLREKLWDEYRKYKEGR